MVYDIFFNLETTNKKVVVEGIEENYSHSDIRNSKIKQDLNG